MRIAPASILPLAALSACLVLGCGIAQLSQGGGGGTSGGAADGGTDATVEAGVQGANCGIESGSGQQLCQATSICPTLVVDTQAFPHCGFRIKGGATELICACGQLLCSMGTYTTCTQAAALLTSQTEQQVCTQLAEDRCSPGAAASSSGSSGTSGSSGATGTCDHQCLSDCGGGGGCASICGC
ncbi:MAG: hypothetical protein JWO86_6258 [Myxococcaceae bacterium]|nr:hypothetical protein [Myxococcaceae bacterium]